MILPHRPAFEPTAGRIRCSLQPQLQVGQIPMVNKHSVAEIDPKIPIKLIQNPNPVLSIT
jgi:hypothetical protein